jgi:hypothetical protein
MKFPRDSFNFYVKSYIREEDQTENPEEFKISSINNKLRNLNSILLSEGMPSLSSSFKDFRDTKDKTLNILKSEENYSNFKDISNIENAGIDKPLNSKSLNFNISNNSKNINTKKLKNYTLKKKNYISTSPQSQKRTYKTIMREMESNLKNEKMMQNANLEVSLKNTSDDMYKKYSNSIKEFMNKNKNDLKLVGGKEFKHMSIEDIIEELQTNPEKLTPIPRKWGQVKNKLEKNESYNIERSAVVLRRLEYASMLNRFSPIFNEEYEESPIDEVDPEVKIQNACVLIQTWWRSKFKELKIRNYYALNDVIRFFKMSRIHINVKFLKKRLFIFGYIIQKIISNKLSSYFETLYENRKISLPLYESFSGQNFTLEEYTDRKVQDKNIICFPKMNKSYFSTKIIKIYPLRHILLIQKVCRKILINKNIKKHKKVIKPINFSKKTIFSNKIFLMCLIKIQNKIKRFIKYKSNPTSIRKRILSIKGISSFSKRLYLRNAINKIILIQRKIRKFLIIKSYTTKRLNTCNNLTFRNKTVNLKNNCEACLCKSVPNCVCDCHEKYSEPRNQDSFYSLLSDINSFRNTQYKI